MLSGTSVATLLGWLPILLGFATPGGQPTVTRMVVQEQLIIKIPVRPRPLPREFRWVEHKGPKCIETEEIRGAVLSGPEDVDFVLKERKRVRAKFSDTCHALDFYQGFYLKPDGPRVCAKRDFVHSRMGSSCRIEGFRSLTAERPD